MCAPGRVTRARRCRGTSSCRSEQESRADFPVGADGRVQYAHLLLSGGGANGAFGAGLLNGWTKTGTRPVFKIVTGVSTGALMAPFAFLGPKYDDALREFYTTTGTHNIFQRLLDRCSQLFVRRSPGRHRPARNADRAAVDEHSCARWRGAHEPADDSTSARSTSTRSASSCGTWD